MKKTNKVFIGLIVLVLSIFVLAKATDSISTWAVKSRLYPKEESKLLTSVTINPKEIKEGKFLNIEITPGNKGSSNYILIYKVKPGPDIFVDRGYRFCRHESTICKKGPYRFEYRFPIEKKLGPGDYYIDVYDFGKESRVRTFFKVKE